MSDKTRPVHNHGPEEGEGLACWAKSAGDCMVEQWKAEARRDALNEAAKEFPTLVQSVWGRDNKARQVAEYLAEIQRQMAMATP